MRKTASMLLRDSSAVPAECHGAVIALGNFDGLHLGHQAVIGKAIALAKETGRPAAVMTFEPHPRRVFAPELPPLRILPLNEKLHLLQDMQLDYLRVVRFTRAFSATSAEDFVTLLLHEDLRVSHVVTGEDFVFGHNRAGDTDSLKAMAQKLGFSATTCPPVPVAGERCSSTRIREALAEGNMLAACQFLARPYLLQGHVLQGDKRGRTLGFPTANLLPPPIFLPAFGVYAVRAQIRGQVISGIANLGLRPTFGGTKPRLEIHLFDWHKEIYGERIAVELVQHVRGEIEFGGAEALKAQIAEDVKTARAMLQRFS